MPDPVREQILAAVAARLDTLTGVTVKRTPDYAFKITALPAIAVFGGGHEILDQTSGVNTVRMRIWLGCHVKASGHDGLDPAVSDLHARAIAAALGGDQSLGGLVISLTEAVMEDPDFDDEGGAVNSQFRLGLDATFQTEEFDPAALAP